MHCNGRIILLNDGTIMGSRDYVASDSDSDSESDSDSDSEGNVHSCLFKNNNYSPQQCVQCFRLFEEILQVAS